MDKRIYKDKIIERCILRSQYISYLKASLITHHQSEFFLNRVPTSFPSKSSLSDLNQEITNTIDEFKRDISRYLSVLFKEKDIQYEDKFWFSRNDLKKGYIELSRKLFDEISHVLFLNNARSFEGNIIKKGSILPYCEVAPILETVETVKNYEESLSLKKMLDVTNCFYFVA